MAKVNATTVKADTLAAPVKGKGKGKGKDTRTELAPQVKDKPVKGKGKGKPVNLSVARVELDAKQLKRAGVNAKYVETVRPATNVKGVKNCRAKLFGFSVSSVWRWCGFNGWSLPDTLALRDGAGLNGDGLVTDQNVRCQFYDGMGRAAGRPALYGGKVADLSKADAAAARKLAGLK